MPVAISRQALTLPSGLDIRIGAPVDGLTVSALARAAGSLLAHRGLSVSQALCQVGDWRTDEGSFSTPAVDVFELQHQVSAFATWARVAFWYGRSEEKPTGAGTVEVEWIEPDGSTVFATTTWDETQLEPTPVSRIRTVNSGLVQTQGGLVGQEGYGAAPFEFAGADPDPRMVDVSAFRGQTITLRFTLDEHRLYSVHVSDLAEDEV